MSACIDQWHKFVNSGDMIILDNLLATNVVFHSPVVHTPQCGIDITKLYLAGARQVFTAAQSEPFMYIREIIGNFDALLEFEAKVEGIHINGIDLIRWDHADKIVDFKVMVRPLKAVNMLHQQMAALLETLS